MICLFYNNHAGRKDRWMEYAAFDSFREIKTEADLFSRKTRFVLPDKTG
jgi:hypothetical protein